MRYPPFIDIISPVIKDDSSEARKYASDATSCGVPIRIKGVSSIIDAITSSVSDAFISVRITPGAIAYTVIPEGPTSLASALVKPRSAALVVEYATSHDAPICPHIEDTLMILPCFFCIISGKISFV